MTQDTGHPSPDPAADLDELRRQLAQERLHAEQWRRVAEERRLVLERLRRNPVIDRGLRLRERLRRHAPTVRPALELVTHVARAARSLAGRGRVVAAQTTATQRRRVLQAQMVDLPPVEVDPRRVAIVVLTRDGRDRLEVLLPWLRRLPGEREVIVVDNASRADTREWLASQPGIRLVRLDQPADFGTANNLGVAEASADAVCLCNDDVEPLDVNWLDRMLAHLREDTGIVGAQLVYPQRGVLRSSRPDLTVQHRGVLFRPRGGAVPRAANVMARTPDPFLPPAEVAAVTGACMLVDRGIWDELGGLSSDYHFGAEDVDFCWRARRRGARSVVVPEAVLYHHEGATRLSSGAAQARTARQEDNWRRFDGRFGPDVTRQVLLDRLAGGGPLCDRPLVVAITVTRDDASAGYGDWYTARGLGDAMQALGWQVRYVQRHGDDWYDLDDDVDVVVSLLDTFDVRRVARPGRTCVAWVRNWTDRWLSRDWWGHHDIVLAGSSAIADRIAMRAGGTAHVFPLATDPERFVPHSGPRHGVVLAMNHWGTDDRIGPLLERVPDLELYGKGWEGVPEVAGNWHRHLSQEALAQVYGRARVVVDRAAVHTRDDGSLNARVFDALAAGAAVVTDQVDGADELFGGDLPVYEGPGELAEVLSELEDDSAWNAIASCRDEVLANHTWATRARALQSLLVERAQRDRWLVQTSAPAHAREGWGDWHLGMDVAVALRRRGHAVWVVPMEEWDAPLTDGFDVAVHLRGRGVAPSRPGRVDIIWAISHPDELEPAHLEAVDLVMAASETLAADLAARTSTPVSTLLQATDPRRFLPCPDPAWRTSVLFVGNSRYTDRRIVSDAIAARLPLTVIGRGWEDRLPPHVLHARQVANAVLPRLYSSADVVLNDHWDDMRRWGIVSNRVFDALACEAVVVSDDLPALHEILGDVVVTYVDEDDLGAQVHGLLQDPGARRRRGRRGRELVLEHHTIDDRVTTLLDGVRELRGRS